MSRGGNLSRTTRKVVLAYARRRARRAYIRLLVWWYTRPCHSFNVRRTMLYGRRYVKVVETVEGNGVVHHSDVDSSDAPYSVVAPSWTMDGIFRVFIFIILARF
jgi:hypothetical protein